MTREEFYRKATNFIIDQVKVKPAEILPNTPLIINGIMDSLMVTEMIIFVENIIGRNIDIDDFKVDSLESLERIYDGLIAPALSEAA